MSEEDREGGPMKVVIVYGRLILIAFLFTHQTGFSAVSETAIIEGVIVKYDKKTVTVIQNGKKFKLLKKHIPKRFKIKTGNKVYAVLNGKKIIGKTKKRAPASTKKSKTGK